MRVEPPEIVTALDSTSSIGSRQLVYDQVSASYRLPPLPEFPASTKFFQDLKAVHASGATGAGVGVGIVDSGVLWEHPVLRWSRQRSINFSGTRNDSDEYGHGTLVAFLIKAIVPDVSFVSAKVLDEKGRCSADKLLEAMRWIGSQGVQVINLSLGVAKDGPMQDCECSLCSLANELALKGIVVCVALGNDSTKSYHPGCAKHVLTASVLGPDGFPLYIRARTKKHQPPTITVPEFLVPSLAAPYDGRTSMGCSYLAGVSALIWGIWVERQTSSTSVADLEKSGFSRQTVANFLVTKGSLLTAKGKWLLLSTNTGRPWNKIRTIWRRASTREWL